MPPVRPDGEASLSSLESGTDETTVPIIREGSSSIPATGTLRCWIRCEKVSYAVKKTQILHDIDCTLPPGKLIALMGPSGAGKTTLLNVLSARGAGRVSGALTLNGQKVTRGLMKRHSKLVPQDDILQPVLTAREMLMYTARLAIDASDAERAARVNDILDTLSLQSCADVVIGGEEVKGLSGGQKKRVSIGMEMLANPACLFLDEPSSGLDSKVAEDVVDLIAALALGGRTVVCTIHQPSFQVFRKFDWLVMLDKGRVAFDGPVAAVADYLGSIGAAVPEFVNPSDHMMFVLSQPVPGGAHDTFHDVFMSTDAAEVAAREAERQQSLCADYMLRKADVASAGAGKKKRTGGKSLATLRDADADADSPSADALTPAQDGAYAVSSWQQYKVLASRALSITFKDKRQFRMRIGQLSFLALLMGTIFFRIPNEQKRVQDKLSVMFLMVLFLGMSSIMSTAMVVGPERALVNREVNNNYYGMLPYFFGRVSVLLSMQIFYTVLFASVGYFLVGLRPGAEHFFTFILVLGLIAMVTGAFGYAAGLAFPTMQGVAAVVPMLVMPLSLFAGLFIKLENIPDYWVWLYYLSPFQYALASLVINEYDDRYFEACSPEALARPGDCPYGACNPADPFSPLPCPGSVVLVSLGYDPKDLWRNLGYIIGLVVLALLFGILMLRKLLRKMN